MWTKEKNVRMRRWGEERPEEVTTSSGQTKAKSLTNKLRQKDKLATRPATSLVNRRKQQQHHHYHQQQQEYSSSSSPQQAIFRATLFRLHNRPFSGPHSSLQGNKPCSRTEGDKQQHHHHHHHQQQQEYSSSRSPQQALFRATLSRLHNGPFPGPHSLVSTTGPFQDHTLLFRTT